MNKSELSPYQQPDEHGAVKTVKIFYPEKAIAQMVGIQNDLNTKSYDSAWLEKGRTGEFDYTIAAAQETGEFLDSLPFAWWSSQAEDRQNCITELVDAWHFIMSQAIIDTAGDQDKAVGFCLNAYEDANANYPTQVDKLDIQRLAKGLVVALYSNVQNDVRSTSSYLRAFFHLCLTYGVDMGTLYARYIAKATLNQFRQENGYSTKPRTYKKTWTFDGKTAEDNYFVSTFVDQMLEEGYDVTADLVRAYLNETYDAVK